MRAGVLFVLFLLSLSYASHIRRFAQEELRPNQYLIFDDDDTSILVDTGTGSEQGNLDLEDFIESQGVESLQTIFITHGHPDHYGGVPYLSEIYPEAIIEVGSTAIYNELIANAAVSFPSVDFDWANNVQIHEDDETFDELDLLLLHDFPASESQAFAMVYNHDENWIITGDALSIDFHPYLGPSVNIVDLRNWYQVTLPAIADGGSVGLNRNTLYYPGHGPPGDYIQVEILIEYLAEFDDLVISCPNTEFPIRLTTVRDSLIADYPLFEGREILDFMVTNPAWGAAQISADPCAFFRYTTNNSAILSFSFALLLVLLVL